MTEIRLEFENYFVIAEVDCYWDDGTVIIHKYTVFVRPDASDDFSDELSEVHDPVIRDLALRVTGNLVDHVFPDFDDRSDESFSGALLTLIVRREDIPLEYYWFGVDPYILQPLI